MPAPATKCPVGQDRPPESASLQAQVPTVLRSLHALRFDGAASCRQAQARVQARVQAQVQVQVRTGHDFTPSSASRQILSPQKPTLTRHGQPQGKPFVCAIPDPTRPAREAPSPDTDRRRVDRILASSFSHLPLPCLSATVLLCAVASQSFDVSRLNLPVECCTKTPQYYSTPTAAATAATGNLISPTTRHNTTRHALDPIRHDTIYDPSSRSDTSH